MAEKISTRSTCNASEELAERARLNERYVREWLGSMVTGGNMEYEPAARRYACGRFLRGSSLDEGHGTAEDPAELCRSAALNRASARTGRRPAEPHE
jgi:winged helix-turn-helix protein